MPHAVIVDLEPTVIGEDILKYIFQTPTDLCYQIHDHVSSKKLVRGDLLMEMNST